MHYRHFELPKKSLTESLADHIENPKRAEANELRASGIGRYVMKESISGPVSAVIGLGVAVGLGALAGEAMDHVPYISKAVPEAIQGLTNSDYFYGNLDKLGATLGFIRKYLTRT